MTEFEYNLRMIVNAIPAERLRDADVIEYARSGISDYLTHIETVKNLKIEMEMTLHNTKKNHLEQIFGQTQSFIESFKTMKEQHTTENKEITGKFKEKVEAYKATAESLLQGINQYHTDIDEATERMKSFCNKHGSEDKQD